MEADNNNKKPTALHHQSLWEQRCMWAHVCVGGVHVSVYVCVWGGVVNRIPRPCYCWGFLKVTMCLEILLLVLHLWATSRLPLPPVTICTTKGLPKPSPAHTSSQNIRTSHQVTLDVKTQFTAKEREISGPRSCGAGIHIQWCQTPKPHSTPGTGTRWQKGLLSSLTVERRRGPSARKGLKSHTGWELCAKGVLFVLRLSSTAGPAGMRAPSFTVAELPGVHNGEEERGRQSPPKLSNERKMVFPDSHRQVPGAIWGWSLQAGWFEMLPNGYRASKSRPPWGRSCTWVWEGDGRAGIQAVLPPPPQAQEGLFNPSGVPCAFPVELACGLVKRYL